MKNYNTQTLLKLTYSYIFNIRYIVKCKMFEL